MYKTESVVRYGFYSLADGFHEEEEMYNFLVKTVDTAIDSGIRSVKMRDLPDFKRIEVAGFLLTDTNKGWQKLYILSKDGTVYSSGSTALLSTFDKIIDEKTGFQLTHYFVVQLEHKLNKKGDRTYDTLKFIGSEPQIKDKSLD